jgi:hypothetical protein
VAAAARADKGFRHGGGGLWRAGVAARLLAAGGTTEALGAHLMAAIAAVVPVLPVPLVAGRWACPPTGPR